MARVKLPSPEDLSQADREFMEEVSSYGPFGSLVGAMANRPPIMRHVFGMLTELKQENVQRFQELDPQMKAISQIRNIYNQSFMKQG